MGKLFILICLIFVSINLSAYMGDGMGEHKAKKNLNMNSHSIDNIKEASLTAGCTAQNFYGSGEYLTNLPADSSKLDASSGAVIQSNKTEIDALHGSTLTITNNMVSVSANNTFTGRNTFKSSTTFENIQVSTIDANVLLVSTIVGKSPIILQTEAVNIAGGAINVRNNSASKASVYIPISNDSLALAITSSTAHGDNAPSANPRDARYSLAIDSAGWVYPKGGVVWADGTTQVTAPTAGGGGVMESSVTISAGQMIVNSYQITGANYVYDSVEETVNTILSTATTATAVEFKDSLNGRADYRYYNCIRTNPKIIIDIVTVGTGNVVGTHWIETWVSSSATTGSVRTYSIIQGTVTPNNVQQVITRYEATLTGYIKGTAIMFSWLRRVADTSNQAVDLLSATISE